MGNSLLNATITAPSRTTLFVLQLHLPVKEVALVHHAMPYRAPRFTLKLIDRSERFQSQPSAFVEAG